MSLGKSRIFLSRLNMVPVFLSNGRLKQLLSGVALATHAGLGPRPPSAWGNWLWYASNQTTAQHSHTTEWSTWARWEAHDKMADTARNKRIHLMVNNIGSDALQILLGAWPPHER